MRWLRCAGEAAFDSREEAQKEAVRLGAADCVLCSYEVLHKEVHFAPNEARLGSLRHQKKYEIAESPLLRLRCACCVCMLCCSMAVWQRPHLQPSLPQRRRHLSVAPEGLWDHWQPPPARQRVCCPAQPFGRGLHRTRRTHKTQACLSRLRWAACTHAQLAVSTHVCMRCEHPSGAGLEFEQPSARSSMQFAALAQA